jgi:TetR/AcrR family transcriptional regulator, regulator of mycofactocin system
MKTSVVAPRGPTLIERKQESVRTAIGEHAVRLFVDQSFQATTIDDIAKAAGIGRRTFFRYFETKEDVVLWKFDQFARRVVTLLEQRPARETALVALQRALTEASEFYNQDPALTRTVLALIAGTPDLYAHALVQHDRWKAWFANALRKRTRASARSVVPEIAASAGLEAATIATRRWLDTPGSNLSELIASCFSALRKVVAAAKT